MIRRSKLRLSIDLQGALWIIGQDAKARFGARGEAIRMHCDQLAAKVGKTRITVTIPGVDALVAAVEEFRQRGDQEGVAAINDLIKDMTDKPHKILGTFQYNINTKKELDTVIENLHKQATRKAGG